MSRYLHHVTLTTGDSRRSYRHEASDAAVDFARKLIVHARAEGRASLIGPAAPCDLTVTIDGHALLATISAPAGPHVPEQVYRGLTMPLVTIAVPRKARVAPALWTLIADRAGPASPPPRPPSPWCAVWIHETLGAYPQASAWLGDLERLIAWAWIESDG